VCPRTREQHNTTSPARRRRRKCRGVRLNPEATFRRSHPSGRSAKSVLTMLFTCTLWELTVGRHFVYACRWLHSSMYVAGKPNTLLAQQNPVK